MNPYSLQSSETIKYIPQNYLEDICTELKQSADTQFDRELKEVIFSHVAEAERLGCNTLDELIQYRNAEAEQRIRLIVNDVQALNVQIAETEGRMLPSYRDGLVSQLNRAKAELEAHDRNEPQACVKPEDDQETRAATEAIVAELLTHTQRVEAVKVEIDSERERERKSVRMLASADKLDAKISNLERQYAALLVEGAGEAEDLGIVLAETVKLSVDRPKLAERRRLAEVERDAARLRLDPAVETSLLKELNTLQAEAEALRGKLDEPNKRYQAYLAAYQTWHEKHVELEGVDERPNSFKGLGRQIELLDSLPAEYSALTDRRAALCREIFSTLDGLLSEHRRLYAPVQAFIDGHAVAGMLLQFEATVTNASFADDFFDLVNRGRKGSFYSQDDGAAKLADLLGKADFQTADGVLEFISEILVHLREDRRPGAAVPVSLSDQLRQGVTTPQMYDFLFSLSYLAPRFELQWEGRRLDQLSQGERGTLLLIFYLLIDKRDVPFVIDQPEENLDNQTITKILVACIKDAKTRRQIIIVTHNPNLALVCDADQIIHACIDKSGGNRVIYRSGAIENPELNQMLVDVLEGTKPAFDLRDAKYEVVERARAL